jgi:hypothetical protein
MAYAVFAIPAFLLGLLILSVNIISVTDLTLALFRLFLSSDVYLWHYIHLREESWVYVQYIHWSEQILDLEPNRH